MNCAVDLTARHMRGSILSSVHRHHELLPFCDASSNSSTLLAQVIDVAQGRLHSKAPKHKVRGASDLPVSPRPEVGSSGQCGSTILRPSLNGGASLKTIKLRQLHQPAKLIELFDPCRKCGLTFTISFLKTHLLKRMTIRT
jgi:hypothetical protein